MDWWNIVGLIVGSTVASGISAVVAAGFVFRSKLDRMEATSDQRVKDWEKWRVQLEERLNARSSHLAAHEKECRERWEKLLMEHGGVMERLRSIDSQMQESRGRSRR